MVKTKDHISKILSTMQNFNHKNVLDNPRPSNKFIRWLKMNGLKQDRPARLVPLKHLNHITHNTSYTSSQLSQQDVQIPHHQNFIEDDPLQLLRWSLILETQWITQFIPTHPVLEGVSNNSSNKLSFSCFPQHFKISSYGSNFIDWFRTM